MTTNDNLTVRQRFRNAVKSFKDLEESPLRQDLEGLQETVVKVIHNFKFLQAIVDSLSFFSDNEELHEINTSYLSFLAISYYESCLFMKLLADVTRGGFVYNVDDKLEFKVHNLQIAKKKASEFLHVLDSIGGILSIEQAQKLNTFKSSLDPSIDEINSLSGNPVTRRAEKIANFTLERELRQKLAILDSYYSKETKSEESDDELIESLDEEIVRQVYIDQLKYFSLLAFDNLELIALELQVLSNRPTFEKQKLERERQAKREKSEDEFGYTSKLEVLLNQPKKISDLISKQGRILQPFTISNKQELRNKVFGTGQVLPSMTVEEYLDYELANGKMLKEDSNTSKFSSDEEDSDQELEARQWDDWKDDHPKGSGNIKGNIG